MDFLVDSDKIKIIDIPFHDRAFGWDKRITIIYDDKDLLINCSSFGLGSVKLPLVSFCDKYLEKKILKKIKLKTHHNTL